MHRIEFTRSIHKLNKSAVVAWCLKELIRCDLFSQYHSRCDMGYSEGLDLDNSSFGCVFIIIYFQSNGMMCRLSCDGCVTKEYVCDD
jgi:hypothetical protein